MDLKKHISKEDFKIIIKLDIKIKSKIYTEQKFKYLDINLLSYYIADDMYEEELKKLKQFPKYISGKEHNNLFEKINKKSNEYDF